MRNEINAPSRKKLKSSNWIKVYYESSYSKYLHKKEIINNNLTSENFRKSQKMKFSTWASLWDNNRINLVAVALKASNEMLNCLHLPLDLHFIFFFCCSLNFINHFTSQLPTLDDMLKFPVMREDTNSTSSAPSRPKNDGVRGVNTRVNLRIFSQAHSLIYQFNIGDERDEWNAHFRHNKS